MEKIRAVIHAHTKRQLVTYFKPQNRSCSITVTYALFIAIYCEVV